MLVPHSGKSILSVELNFFFLSAFIFVLALLVAAVIFFSLNYFNVSVDYSNTKRAYQDNEENLEVLSEELQNTANVNNRFLQELDLTARLIDVPFVDKTGENVDQGDFSNVLQFSKESVPSFEDASSLVLLRQKISDSLPVLKKVNSFLENNNRFLRDVPIYLPVRNANISMEWGPNIHPIYGYWYLHKGIDFAAPTGSPVYAVADGVVSFVGNDKSYGNHIFVSHNYGFKTHYSHMKNIKVYKGEIITQGQTIGSVGSTGVATGPHLDFQIYLGNELIDPGRYIRYLKDYKRPKGNR